MPSGLGAGGSGGRPPGREALPGAPTMYSVDREESGRTPDPGFIFNHWQKAAQTIVTHKLQTNSSLGDYLLWRKSVTNLMVVMK